jgi:ribonuclease VapC
MILDSSAVIALLRGEPEASAISREIELANKRCICAVNYVEAAVVIETAGDAIASRRFDDFIRASRITIEPVTPRQAEIARQAYRDFGKGRHKAGLSLGGCFAYALAKDLDDLLLCKGNDFKHTDLEIPEI